MRLCRVPYERCCQVTVRAIALSAVAALLTLSTEAAGYNGITHLDMVDMAYQIMKSANQSDPDFRLGPSGDEVTSEWAAFRAAMQKAVEFWQNQPAGLPPPKKPTSTNDYAPGQPMKKVPIPVTPDWIVGEGYADNPSRSPGGIYNKNDETAGGDNTGTVLGFWAQHIDDLVDDTHLWMRPTSSAAFGGGWVKDLFNDFLDSAAIAAIAPLICLVNLLQGDLDCWEDAKKAGKDLNQFDNLEGLLPGIGDISGANWVGMWHYVQMSGQTNDFDDRPGHLLDETSPGVGSIDMGIMILADTIGLSLNHGASDGPHKYTVTSGDLHPKTVVRSKGEWQYPTIAHLAFEPLDNLAQYGWANWKANWKSTGSTRFLGYPLHALGDAVAPHHVGGSPGWGHRPYEDAVEQRWLWIRFVRLASDGNPPLSDEAALAVTPLVGSPRFLAQKQQGDRIIRKALKYRQLILNWRKANSGQGTDLPIRDLVTWVAKEAHEYSMMRFTSVTWPYLELASMSYHFDSEEKGVSLYTGFPDGDALVAPLIEEGIAAMIAFLISAPEAVQ
jgi:hypothetical protein